MTDEKLGELFGAFANYYWSASLNYVLDKIEEWHPEVNTKQIEKVLNQCNKDLFRYHCCVVEEGLDEPELVAEQLVFFERRDLDTFLAVRMDIPYCDCDEETLFRFDKDFLSLPEGDAIIDFVKTEFDLDDSWGRQLLHNCIFSQPASICDGTSWVKDALSQEDNGQIHFRTIEQVKRFRDLGNRFYQVFPNPILKGWKPSEVENAPILIDDIPERAEDIPNRRKGNNKLLAQYDAWDKVHGGFTEQVKAKKVGPNDPCPCGSGKKYKKCCGR